MAALSKSISVCCSFSFYFNLGGFVPRDTLGLTVVESLSSNIIISLAKVSRCARKSVTCVLRDSNSWFSEDSES